MKTPSLFAAFLLSMQMLLYGQSREKIDNIIDTEKKQLYHNFTQNSSDVKPFENLLIQNIFQEWVHMHSDLEVSFTTNIDNQCKKYILDTRTKKLFLQIDISLDDLVSLIGDLHLYIHGKKNFSYASKHKLTNYLRELIYTLYQNNKNKDSSITIHKYQKLLHQLDPEIDTSLYDISNTLQNTLDHYNPIRDEYTPNETIRKALWEVLFEQGEKQLLHMFQPYIPLQRYKQEVETARKIYTTTKVAEVEKTIIRQIIRDIHNSPIDKDVVDRSYFISSSPNHIRTNQKISCVGLSILMHAICEELHIPHNIVFIDNHSATVVHLANKDTYYCDPSAQAKIHFQKIDYHPNIYGNQLTILGTDTIPMNFSTENGLLGQLAYNAYTYGSTKSGSILSKQDQFDYLRFIISLEPYNPQAWYDLAYLYYTLRAYQKALDAINVAITLQPQQQVYRALKLLIAQHINNIYEYEKAKTEYEKIKNEK